MRILRVAQKLYPESKGGGAYHVHAMSRDQAAMGHDVTVLTVGDGPPQEDRDGYTVVRKRALVEPLGNGISPHAAWYLRRQDEFDVVHAHSHLYFSTNLAALARRLGETPLAITNHGLYSQTAPKRVFEAYLRTLGRWTFNSTDVVFCYSDVDRERLRAFGVGSPVEVVPNGIDTDRFAPDGPESDLIDDSPAVLFAGRLVDGKRPTDAVRTLASVRARGIDATLYVAGDGSLEPEMRSIAADRGVTDAVRFLGHVPYDEMPSVFRAVDALLLPSRDEGMPRTVLEALASGTPVVVSDLPQLEWIEDHRGRTVPVGDVEQFAEALDELLSDAETTPRRGSRQSLLPKNLEWETTVTKTTRHLAGLVNRGSRVP